jgi:ADP-ribose pyrophosphatase YjhB (NUDIX family)
MPESTRPAQTTLAVVFQVRAGKLQVLLWERAKEPFSGDWSLPGGYLEPGETLEQSIRRHLAGKVDVRELSHLEQLETLSDPQRHPNEWQLVTAYLGIVPLGVDPALTGCRGSRSTTGRSRSPGVIACARSSRTRTSASPSLPRPSR